MWRRDGTGTKVFLPLKRGVGLCRSYLSEMDTCTELAPVDLQSFILSYFKADISSLGETVTVGPDHVHFSRAYPISLFCYLDVQRLSSLYDATRSKLMENETHSQVLQ